MKWNSFKILVASLAIALAAAVALAQTATEMHHPLHGRGTGLGFEQRMLGLMTEHLQLTDAQQAQVKQIFASQKPTVLPLMQQLAQNHLQLMTLAQSGNFDEEKVRAVASQQAQLTTELEVAKTRAMSEIFTILTPEQKAKAVEFMHRREAHLAEHMQHEATPEQ
jgi:periplasmic protein CpxP/Spy